MAQKVYRVATVLAYDQVAPAIQGFKKRMGELGYIEGKSVRYDAHNARGDAEGVKKIAWRLVQEKPDVIVTTSTATTAPIAKAVSGTNLPVLFLSAANPLAFVKSYASSGNNLTGISTAAIDLTPKRMELLTELAPAVKKVISINNPGGVSYKENLDATRDAAGKLGLQLVDIDISTREELILWVKTYLSRKLGDALFYPPDGMILNATPAILPYIVKAKLPSVSVNVLRIREGALAAYGPDFFALGQQGAALADKILKGASPASIPIEQPAKLYLGINLKTARAIGLKISKELLIRADEVIE